jgi:hypothetical protein
MPTSDEDLAALKERVEQKRQDLADAESERVTAELALANDMVAAQLQAEEARLDVALSQAREATKAERIEQGVAAPLAQAKAEMEQALAAQKAAEEAQKAADEAAQNPPSEETPPADTGGSDTTSGEGQ